MFRAQTPWLQSRKAQAVAILLAALAAAGLVADWVLGGWSQNLVLAGVGAVGIAITVKVLNDWRSGFYLFLVWLLFEDLVRKYLGNNMVIYFAKDVLAGLAYISFFVAFRRGQVPSFRPRFLVPFLFLLWLGVFQVFNPASPSLLYGLLGLKLYFCYMPLVFLGYALVRSDEDLRRLLVVNMGLAAIIALLGVIQAIRGPEFLNPTELAPEIRALSRLVRVAPISGQRVFRPNSVFVSDGRFAWFLILMLVVGLGAAGYLLLRGSRGNKFVSGSIPLVVVGIMLSGSRGAFLYSACSVLVLLAAFLWGAPWRWGRARWLIRTVQRALVLSSIGVFVMILFFPEAMGARWAFYSETLSPQSPKSELAWRGWDYPVRNFMLAFDYERWPYGYGIGTASLGVQYLSRLLGENTPGIGVESGFGTLIVELGILGPILWLAWVLTLLVSAWRAVRRLKETPYFPVGFSILWFAFLLLVPFTYAGMQAYQNYVFNAYFWFLVGVLFRLPSLAAQASTHATAPVRCRRESPCAEVTSA